VGKEKPGNRRNLAITGGSYVVDNNLEYLRLGLNFETPGRTITEADIVNYAYLSGDWNPIHTDAEYAERTDFGKIIAHGLLTLTIVGGLLARLGRTDRSPIILYGIDKVRFLKPVFVGDTIKVRGEVIQIAERKNYRLVTYEIKAVNQKGEVVLNCYYKIAVKKDG
jgi:acyl dehydratase